MSDTPPTRHPDAVRLAATMRDRGAPARPADGLLAGTLMVEALTVEGLEIGTPRLVLRGLGRADVPDLVRLAGERALAAMTARIPHPYTAEDAEGFVARSAAGASGGVPVLSRAIVRREDGRLVGCIGLRGEAEASTALELAYWVGVPYWNRGYATEAARAMVDHAFTHSGAGAVTAACRVVNGASRRVLERAGLHYVGSGLAQAPARGGMLPVDRFQMTRADWLSLKAWRTPSWHAPAAPAHA